MSERKLTCSAIEYAESARSRLIKRDALAEISNPPRPSLPTNFDRIVPARVDEREANPAIVAK